MPKGSFRLVVGHCKLTVGYTVTGRCKKLEKLLAGNRLTQVAVESLCSVNQTNRLIYTTELSAAVSNGKRLIVSVTRKNRQMSIKLAQK